MGRTHIWVHAHQLDDTLVEVASITQETIGAGNVVCVSQSLKNGIIRHWNLTALPKLLLVTLM